MCLVFSNGKEGLITYMQSRNKKKINCWWETVATGPCYHIRSLIGMGRGKDREKNLQEIVSRCPAHSTGVVGASKSLSVLLLFYLPALHQRL